MHFSIFKEILWKIATILWRADDPSPDPLRGRPPKVLPPNRNPGSVAEAYLNLQVGKLMNLNSQIRDTMQAV